MRTPEIWPRHAKVHVPSVPGLPGSGGGTLTGDVFEVVDVDEGADGDAWYDHVATLPTGAEAECWVVLRYGDTVPWDITPRCDRRRLFRG